MLESGGLFKSRWCSMSEGLMFGESQLLGVGRSGGLGTTSKRPMAKSHSFESPTEGSEAGWLTLVSETA
eukprot:942974-Alexandrium_andersonii.AAC.1